MPDDVKDERLENYAAELVALTGNGAGQADHWKQLQCCIDLRISYRTFETYRGGNGPRATTYVAIIANLKEQLGIVAAQAA